MRAFPARLRWADSRIVDFLGAAMTFTFPSINETRHSAHRHIRERRDGDDLFVADQHPTAIGIQPMPVSVQDVFFPRC